MTNKQFEEIIKEYSPHLRLTVNNNIPFLGAMYFKDKIFDGVPRDRFVKNDIINKDGYDITVIGLKTVAKRLFLFGHEQKFTNWFNKWINLCKSFELTDKEINDLITYHNPDYNDAILVSKTYATKEAEVIKAVAFA